MRECPDNQLYLTRAVQDKGLEYCVGKCSECGIERVINDEYQFDRTAVMICGGQKRRYQIYRRKEEANNG